MDKTNNLQYFLTDIADAIREKKGTSDLINAQNFADEIRNMPTSGGGEGGGSGEGGGGNTNYKYYLVDRTNTNGLVLMYSALTKYRKDGEIQISPTAYAIQNQEEDVLSCRVNLNDRIYGDGSWSTMSDIVNILETYYGKLTEITEEEFYNLNA